MPGWTIAQLHEVTGMSTSYLRKHVKEFEGGIQEKLVWHIPINGIVNYMLQNKEVLNSFNKRFENNEIKKQYMIAANILKDAISEELVVRASEPLKFLTAKQLVSLPMDPGFSYTQQVTTLCRKKKLVGFKESPERFAIWKIPTESFAYFLLRNADYLGAFHKMLAYNMNYWKGKDLEMFKIANSIKHYLNHMPIMFSENYSIDELSDIFDIPKNQILSTFCSETVTNKIRAKVPCFGNKVMVSWKDVSDYMKLNSDKVQYLYDKWEKLTTERKHFQIKEESDKEYKIRHLLMMYEYYIRSC